MADYLTRLVERTLGLSPSVRPDIPPAFAPEAREPAPHDAPDAHLPPSPRRTGAVAQRPRPETYPGPPERAGEAAAVAREADYEPGVASRYETPPSGPTDRSGGGLARGPGSPVAKNPEEREEVEHHSGGLGAGNDEPPRGPRQPRRSAVPPEVAGPDGAPEPERSGVLPERREAPPSASSAEGPSDRYEPQIELHERPGGPPRSSARPGRRPDAGAPGNPESDVAHEEPDVGRSKTPGERGETASQGRRAGDPTGTVESVASPTEGTVPDRRASLDRARSPGPERPVPKADERGGREGHGRVFERVEDPRGGRIEESATSEHEERHPGPLRRPVPEAPLVPVANRPRGVARGREVGEETSVPTVRVTIGRVEVRAVMPEPAPQPPPPPAMREPALSLEDYLEQHAGGRP